MVIYQQMLVTEVLHEDCAAAAYYDYDLTKTTTIFGFV